MMYSSSHSLSLSGNTKIIRYESQFKSPVQKEDGFTTSSFKLIGEIINSLLNEFNRGINKINRDITNAVDEAMFMITKLID